MNGTCIEQVGVFCQTMCSVDVYLNISVFVKNKVFQSICAVFSVIKGDGAFNLISSGSRNLLGYDQLEGSFAAVMEIVKVIFR